jgi:hypothetical protein
VRRRLTASCGSFGIARTTGLRISVLVDPGLWQVGDV